MKLREWISEAGISVPAFARIANAPAPSVYRWLEGGMSVETMAIVMAVTAGAVTPLDYYPQAIPVGEGEDAKAAQRRVQSSLRTKSRLANKT